MKNRRVFELRLGKVGLTLFISGMSLLLFSVFLLGIVIGKQMEAYPERYSSGIPELIRDSLMAAVSRQGKNAPPAVNQEKQADQTSGGTDFGLTFYDTLGGKKGGAVTGAQAGSSKHRSSEETPSSATVTGAAKRETVLPGSGGDAGAKKLTPPAEEAGPPGRGSFEVQLAAYRERPQAEELTKKFAGSGFTPRVVMKDLPGKGRWFRVIVGGFESRQTAQDAADQMTGKVRGLKCVIRSSGS